jgi:hypothetical protein
MRQPPSYTSWRITCHSTEEAQALMQRLSSQIDPNRVMTDTIHVAPNGVEQVQNVPHRLGDYFATIRLVPAGPASPTSFRLVFHQREGAGRFWKDLMVNILQAIETSPQTVSIDLDVKGESK